jgi:predicted phosphodiesterase
VKVCATADTHGYLPKVPPCDLFLIAGDFCPATNHNVAYQAGWLETKFKPWLESVPAKKIVGVAGNHDFIFERTPSFVPALPWTYLQDNYCIYEGLKIYGTPWQPPFCDWAFNARDEVREKYFSLINTDVNILVTHGPPYGYGDRVRSENVGCKFLRHRLDSLVELKLHVFGHIHENYNEWAFGKAKLANVAYVDENYLSVNPITKFEV